MVLKITIEGKVGEDCPLMKAGMVDEFRKEIEKTVRRRLELRAQDVVEVKVEL